MFVYMYMYNSGVLLYMYMYNSGVLLYMYMYVSTFSKYTNNVHVYSMSYTCIWCL